MHIRSLANAIFQAGAVFDASMSFKIFWFLNIVALSVGLVEDLSDGPVGFGKYFLAVVSLEKCNVTGPIHENLFNTYTIKINNLDDNHQEIDGQISFPDRYQIKKAAYSTELWKHGAYKQIISRNITEPCKDPLIKAVVKISISADSKCNVKKGNYSVTKVDANAISHKLFGNNFFYSRVRTRLEFSSAKGGVFCVNSISESRPVTNVRSKTKDQKK